MVYVTLTIIEILFLFILPVLLIKLNIIRPVYRLKTLILIFLAIIFLVLTENWTLLDLNLRFDNFLDFLMPFAIYIMLGVILIFVNVIFRIEIKVFSPHSGIDFMVF